MSPPPLCARPHCIALVLCLSAALPLQLTALLAPADMVMTDSWFDEYMFEIAAPKEMLPPELLAAFNDTPRVLPAWDPMGSLA